MGERNKSERNAYDVRGRGANSPVGEQLALLQLESGQGPKSRMLWQSRLQPNDERQNGATKAS